MFQYQEDFIIKILIKYGKYSKEQAIDLRFYINISYRILIIFLYYLIGILVYSNIEGWIFLDCIYFITVSVTTVGYGTLHPTNNTSRLFTCLYMLIGIFLVVGEGNYFARKIIINNQNKYLRNLNITTIEKSLYKIGISISMIILMVFIGAITASLLEGWSAIVGFYWTLITMTTIGYGDLIITNQETKVFSLFFIFTCVIIFATSITNIRDALLEFKLEKLRKLFYYNFQIIHDEARNSHSIRTNSENNDDSSTSLSIINRMSNIISKTFLHPIGIETVSVSNTGTISETMKKKEVNHDEGIELNDRKKTLQSDDMIGLPPTITNTSSSLALTSSTSNLTLPQENTNNHYVIQQWKRLNEDKFLIEMLIQLEIVDLKRDVEPILQLYNNIQALEKDDEN